MLLINFAGFTYVKLENIFLIAFSLLLNKTTTTFKQALEQIFGQAIILKILALNVLISNYNKNFKQAATNTYFFKSLKQQLYIFYINKNVIF